MYGNTIDFYILTLYPIILLELTNSNRFFFFVGYLGFCTIQSYCLQRKIVSLVHFHFWIPFKFFLALFILIGTSSTTLKRKCKGEHPSFVPELRGAFPQCKNYVSCRCFIEVLCQNEEVSFYSLFDESFYYKYMLDFVNCFFCLLRWSSDSHLLFC